MVMTIERSDLGGWRVRQRLQRPVIYLDHWAIRLFSDEAALQDRFVEALHRSRGTWLFSAANLYEFTAMTDFAQAESAERLLLRAIPYLHVADTTNDPGYFLAEGAPKSSTAPDEHWMLQDLAARAALTNGAWNTHRFVQDCINHRAEALPLFEKMKASISAAVMALTQDKARNSNAKKFVPKTGMKLREALAQELVRDPHLDPAYHFDDNDAMDFIHAVPAVVVCDLVLLDARWCHKVESATRRIRKGGLTGKIAQCFSKKAVPNFLAKLESVKPPSS